MEKEHGGFTMDQVAGRHLQETHLPPSPHFCRVTVENSAQVLSNWDKLKRREKGQKTTTDAMSSVAASLPALMRAQKVQAKAAKVGFDWDNVGGALDKVREELDETRQALNGQGEVDEEIGDLLFAAVNVARFAGVDARRRWRDAPGNSFAGSSMWNRRRERWEKIGGNVPGRNG